ETRPGGNTNIDTLRQRLRPEILSPFPAGDVDLNGIVKRQNAHFAVAAKNDGADVAGIHVVDADELGHGVEELGGAIADGFHAVDARRIVEAPNVVGGAEDGRPARGGVAPDAFEDARTVVQRVGQDVDGGVLPGDEGTVVPDLFSRLDHKRRLWVAGL